MGFNLQFVETRFFIQNALRFAEDGLRLLRRIAYRSQAQSPGAAKSAEHMENDACLPDLSKVQAAPNGEIKKIVRSEPAIARRLEMIASHQKFLVPIRRDKGSAFWIVMAASEKLQSQERMRGSAFPKVDLDCIGLP